MNKSVVKSKPKIPEFKPKPPVPVFKHKKIRINNSMHEKPPKTENSHMPMSTKISIRKTKSKSPTPPTIHRITPKKLKNSQKVKNSRQKSSLPPPKSNDLIINRSYKIKSFSSKQEYSNSKNNPSFQSYPQCKNIQSGVSQIFTTAQSLMNPPHITIKDFALKNPSSALIRKKSICKLLSPLSMLDFPNIWKS